MNRFGNFIFAALVTLASSTAVAAAEPGAANSGLARGGMDKTYLKECGACHLAYQPQFLPKRSWDKIMSSLDAHFGDDATLDDRTRTQIHGYLAKNSADASASKISRKMLASIGTADTPLRITETKYFKRKHRELRADVFKRKSVGSSSNCSACHPSAEKGDFDEHKVKIPKN